MPKSSKTRLHSSLMVFSEPNKTIGSKFPCNATPSCTRRLALAKLQVQSTPIASAQVKSCILLAGLYADGETSVTEPSLSRNHTELMLREFGADLRTSHSLDSTKATASIRPCSRLCGQKITVPGDISSASYFIAAGLIVPDSEILIENVGINPTRAGILKVCEDMGGNITLLNERTEGGERIADILVKTSNLHGITIEGDIIPTLIDEIPVIAVMAAVAEGTTVIKDASELKVKETDRIETVTDNLKAMGCKTKLLGLREW